MSDNLGYLFAAFLITWVVIGGYFLALGRQVQALRQEVRSLATAGDQADAPPTPARSLDSLDGFDSAEQPATPAGSR